MSSPWLLRGASIGTLFVGRHRKAAESGWRMTATVVFVHGRGQEFKDPAVLVRTWQAGLAAGLVKAGMVPLADAPTVFPYPRCPPSRRVLGVRL